MFAKQYENRELIYGDLISIIIAGVLVFSVIGAPVSAAVVGIVVFMIATIVMYLISTYCNEIVEAPVVGWRKMFFNSMHDTPLHIAVMAVVFFILAHFAVIPVAVSIFAVAITFIQYLAHKISIM